MTETASRPPHWDLTNIYPALDSDAFKADFDELVKKIESFESYHQDALASADEDTPAAELAEIIGTAIDRMNQIYELTSNLRAYIQSFVATDSFNTEARRVQSELQFVTVRLQKLEVQFESFIGKISETLPEVLKFEGPAREHSFALREIAEQSRYLMSEAEETLAAELNMSGASAWGKLQGTITSQMTVDFELDGETKKLPMPALINLRSHPDGSVRARAYEAEMAAWESIKEPLAACMNGVKGTVNTLNKRRGREDALHSAIDSSRIDRATLEAMLSAMKDSFPMFRRYFKAKAQKLGKEKLAWWDVFAPTSKSEKQYSFQEAADFILENFAGFSDSLYRLAKRAFDHNWIDAEQRSGKRGGAFCMSLLKAGESRILCNFDGTLDQVSTVAHELGHAFHNDCAFRAGKTPLQRQTPMTMAETASIMCQTIITNAQLKQASSREEELSILETSLIDDAQVIVDIYSRYLFEEEVFTRREKAELSAEDFCEMMERAQKATYGDGLDERYLHKYMWTWKSHYYREGLSFYNYPYAFGLLFGTGLYAIYQQRGDSFIPDYENLLASTGEGTAADLAERFGINIRTTDFWKASLDIVGKRVERYVEL